MTLLGRFAPWLRREDYAKERYLHAVGRGEAGDTEPTAVRAWLREDPDFARALKAARTQPPGEARFIDMNEIAAEMAREGAIPAPAVNPTVGQTILLEQLGVDLGHNAWKSGW
jgi:hypothetical protein